MSCLFLFSYKFTQFNFNQNLWIRKNHKQFDENVIFHFHLYFSWITRRWNDFNGSKWLFAVIWLDYVVPSLSAFLHFPLSNFLLAIRLPRYSHMLMEMGTKCPFGLHKCLKDIHLIRFVGDNTSNDECEYWICDHSRVINEDRHLFTQQQSVYPHLRILPSPRAYVPYYTFAIWT